MEGLRIACFYSFGCLELKRLGAEKEVLQFINNPKKEKISAIKKILERLEPCLFYRLIALQKKRNDLFDKDIVKSYWLDENLLEKIEKEDIEDLFPEMLTLEHRPFYLKKFSDLIGGLPHHNFETLWLIGKKFPKIFLENLNSCLVRGGEVITIRKPFLTIKTNLLTLKEDKVDLKSSIETVKYGFLKNIEKGDFISIHLGIAREKIKRKTARNLEKIIEKAILFFRRG